MDIGERLAQGTVVVMDGGTGTEIQRRGGRMDDAVWCGSAHMEDPGLVRTIHEDYIRAGAEIVIANTFATSKAVLEASGRGGEFAASNRRAVELAVQAREAAAGKPTWVAGSLSAMLPLDQLDAADPRRGTEAEHREQAEILAAAGADVLIAEMMLDLDRAAPLVRAAAGAGLPLWVGFSASRAADGTLTGFQTPGGYLGRPDGDFDALVRDVLNALPMTGGGTLAGVMHSEVDVTGPALEVLGRHWDGPTMAYAETGHFTRPYWQFEESASPDEYAEAAAGWVADHGVQVVGGCCGTGPDHVRALAERFA